MTGLNLMNVWMQYQTEGWIVHAILVIFSLGMAVTWIVVLFMLLNEAKGRADCYEVARTYLRGRLLWLVLTSAVTLGLTAAVVAIFTRYKLATLRRAECNQD